MSGNHFKIHFGWLWFFGCWMNLVFWLINKNLHYPIQNQWLEPWLVMKLQEYFHKLTLQRCFLWIWIQSWRSDEVRKNCLVIQETTVAAVEICILINFRGGDRVVVSCFQNWVIFPAEDARGTRMDSEYSYDVIGEMMKSSIPKSLVFDVFAWPHHSWR